MTKDRFGAAKAAKKESYLEVEICKVVHSNQDRYVPNSIDSGGGISQGPVGSRLHSELSIVLL